MMKYSITAVIPARQEEARIIQTLDGLYAIRPPIKILVISDRVSSHDQTERLVRTYASTHHRVTLVPKRNGDMHGFTATLQRGVSFVQTPYTVFVMADTCDDPHTIRVMAQKARDGWDIVCASRYMSQGKRIGGPYIQAISSRVVNWFLFHGMGIPTHDASNSYKLYKTTLLRSLSFNTPGTEISIALLLQAYQKGAHITDVPTIWQGRAVHALKFLRWSYIARYWNACTRALSYTVRNDVTGRHVFNHMKHIQRAYRLRFVDAAREERVMLWKTLITCCFGRYIQPSHIVMDIGAGSCEFINSVRCQKKIAVDTNPDTKQAASSGVTVLRCPAEDIPRRYDGMIDVIMMSNVLEHLSTKQDVLMVLDRAYDLLKKGGTLLILQPNIDLVHEAYWDFIDHMVALNGKSVQEALSITGFQTDVYIKRFLPYTTKSRLPLWPPLVRFYLSVPPSIRPFAGQSFFVARKPA